MRRSPASLLAILALLTVLFPATAPADDDSVLPLDSPLRNSAPAVPREPAFALPPVQTTTLANGVRVLLLERKELPIATLRVIATRGAADAAPGVVALATPMLIAGTSTHDSGQIGEAARRLGITTDLDYSYDGTWMNAEFLSWQLEDVLPLVGELFRYSQAPTNVFESTRSKLLVRLAAHSLSPDELLRSALGSAFYPPLHPYQDPLEGEEGVIKGVRREQVLSFLRTQVQPDTIIVIVVGNVEFSRLDLLARRVFGDWKGAAASRMPIPEVTQHPPGWRITLIDRPGATQAMITVGQVGVSDACPDREALLVLNAILGTRSGRLSTDLREARGSTYHARSSFEMARGPRPFLMTASVAPEKVADSTSLMLAEVQRIVTEPVTSDELAFGKAVVRGALPMRFTSLRGAVEALSDLAIAGRSTKDYASLSEKLAALTPELLLRVAKQYLKPAVLRIFVIAEASRVKAQLRSLGLGPVIVNTPLLTQTSTIGSGVPFEQP